MPELNNGFGTWRQGRALAILALVLVPAGCEQSVQLPPQPPGAVNELKKDYDIQVKGRRKEIMSRRERMKLIHEKQREMVEKQQ